MIRIGQVYIYKQTKEMCIYNPYKAGPGNFPDKDGWKVLVHSFNGKYYVGNFLGAPVDNEFVPEALIPLKKINSRLIHD